MNFLIRKYKTHCHYSEAREIYLYRISNKFHFSFSVFPQSVFLWVHLNDIKLITIDLKPRIIYSLPSSKHLDLILEKFSMEFVVILSENLHSCSTYKSSQSAQAPTQSPSHTIGYTQRTWAHTHTHMSRRTCINWLRCS